MLACAKSTKHTGDQPNEFGSTTQSINGNQQKPENPIEQYCSENMLISRYSDFDPREYYSLDQSLSLTRRGGRGGGGGGSRGSGSGSSSGSSSNSGSGGYSSSDGSSGSRGDGGSSSKGGSEDKGSGDGGDSGSGSGSGGSSSGGSGSSSSGGSASGIRNSDSSGSDDGGTVLNEEAVRSNLVEKNYTPLIKDKRFMLRRAYIYRGQSGYSQTQIAITNGTDLNDLWFKHKIRLDWDSQGYWFICFRDKIESDALLIFRGQDGSYKFYKI